MASGDFDEDWEPLTEAELKVIQAKRERSNKISKIMGEYLLKGYKMLASSCEACDCIMLQDKQGHLYCVACNELEASKDDPAVNHDAAMSKIREGGASPGAPPGTASAPLATPPPSAAHATTRAPTTTAAPSLSPNSIANGAAPLTSVASRPPIPNHSGSGSRVFVADVGSDAYEAFAAYSPPLPPTRQRDAPPTLREAPPPHAPSVVGVLASTGLSAPLPPPTHAPLTPSSRHMSLTPAECDSLGSALKRKLMWAAAQLDSTQSAESANALCALIKTCAEAVEAVNKLQSSQS